MVTNFLGITFPHFILGLVLLGLGWNFMFIGGTTLLGETYRNDEQSKAQAVNDFAVFTTVAISSLGSGILQAKLGWSFVNVVILAPMVIVIAMAIWVYQFALKEEKQV